MPAKKGKGKKWLWKTKYIIVWLVSSTAATFVSKQTAFINTPMISWQ